MRFCGEFFFTCKDIFKKILENFAKIYRFSPKIHDGNAALISYLGSPKIQIFEKMKKLPQTTSLANNQIRHFLFSPLIFLKPKTRRTLDPNPRRRVSDNGFGYGLRGSQVMINLHYTVRNKIFASFFWKFSNKNFKKLFFRKWNPNLIKMSWALLGQPRQSFPEKWQFLRHTV